MKIKDNIAIVTGAASGIGLSVAQRLARGGARKIAMVDQSAECEQSAQALNRELDSQVARAFVGDVCAAAFRDEVFDAMQQQGDVVRICVPAAGILRDGLAVKLNRETSRAQLYDEQLFRQVLDVNLIHPVYWAMKTLAQIAEMRATFGAKKWQANESIQGAIIFIGSVSSRGNRGQVSYSAAKSALSAVAKTLNLEGAHHGVQTKIIHPGMVDTPMLDTMPEGHLESHFLPQLPIGRLITPAEIAETVAVLIENPAISGPVWVDGGLAPMA